MLTDEPFGHQPPLSLRLDEEWATMRRRRSLLVAVDRWRLLAAPPADLDDVLVACGYRVSPTAARNETLGRLVELAHDRELAARIVLQRLLPGLLTAAKRRPADPTAPPAFEELVTSAWISIRATNLQPGGEAIGAALISDAYHRAFVAPWRRRSSTELPRDPGHFDAIASVRTPDPFDELVAALAEARHRGLPAEDIELVGHLLRAGSSEAVAAARKVTTRTVRNHRSRTVYRIRRLVTAAA